MEEEEAIPIYFLEVLHGGRCNSEVGQTRAEQSWDGAARISFFCHGERESWAGLEAEREQ